jgi:putative transposase
LSLQPETYYHVYNHSNGDDNIFRESENYRFFLQQYKKYIYPAASTLAYCLMPNHFHLLVRIRSEEEIRKNYNSSSTTTTTTKNLPGFKNLEGLKGEGLKGEGLKDEGLRGDDLKVESIKDESIGNDTFISQQFSNLFNSYSKAFNKRYNRRGSLFLKNFKRKPIPKNNFLLSVISYIHLNPVHHGFVEQIAEWQWSSYNSIIENNSDLIDVSEVIDLFQTRDEFISLHSNILTSKNLPGLENLEGLRGDGVL